MATLLGPHIAPSATVLLSGVVRQGNSLSHRQVQALPCPHTCGNSKTLTMEHNHIPHKLEDCHNSNGKIVGPSSRSENGTPCVETALVRLSQLVLAAKPSADWHEIPSRAFHKKLSIRRE